MPRIRIAAVGGWDALIGLAGEADPGLDLVGVDLDRQRLGGGEHFDWIRQPGLAAAGWIWPQPVGWRVLEDPGQFVAGAVDTYRNRGRPGMITEPQLRDRLAASRMFREKGTAVSLADVMKAIGLTHGGFYKQFASKEDLVDEAIAHAFDKPAAYSPEGPEEHAGEDEAARRTMIEDYLSVWHRDNSGDGCPVSGFAADLGREHGQATRAQHIYANGVRNLAAQLGTGDDGLVQLSTMVGALVLARATEGNPLSEELLQAARTALTDSGAEQSEPQQR